MKKLFALVLLAGLAFAPVTSFATVADEGLGQGANFNASLATGSLDLIQIFPNEAANFGAWADWRFETPDFGAATNPTGWGANTTGQDNWFGISDNKHGLGTWTLFMNRPSKYFTHDAGGVPELDPTDNNAALGFGSTSNAWDDIVNGWGTDNTPSKTVLGSNNNGSWITDYGWFVPTPQEKFSLNFSDAMGDGTIGVEVNYGDATGTNFDSNNTTVQDANPPVIVAGTQLGAKNASDSASQMGLNVGLGTKMEGMNLDLSAGFEIGDLELVDSRLEQNAANNGTNNFRQDSMKAGDGGIYEANVAALLTKDQDENTQLRASLTGTLGNLGIEEDNRNDANNNGNFTTAGDTNTTFENAYANLMGALKFACVHKVDGGKGRLISSLGLSYRDQHFKSQDQIYNFGAQRYDMNYQTDADFTTFIIPVNVGAEQELFDWLTVRMGASSNLLDLESSKEIGYSHLVNGQYTGQETDTYSSMPFGNVDLSSGFSVKVGNFTFDGLLDENFFENTFLADVAPGRGVFFTGNTATVAKVDGTFRY